MTNYIWITTQFEGFHNYKDATDDVSFLRYLHRHLFKVKVYISVNDNIDRDIEFFQFKRFVEQIIKSKDMNNKSCEMIANVIGFNIRLQYKERGVKIEVSEDGECGYEGKY